MESEVNQVDGEVAQLQPVEPIPFETVKSPESEVDPAEEAVTVEFEKPYVYDGQTYAEITLNFPEINNKMYGKIEKDFHTLYPNTYAVPLCSSEAYMQVAAAKAADVPLGLIYSLKGSDATTVRNLTLKALSKTSEFPKVRRATTARK